MSIGSGTMRFGPANGTGDARSEKIGIEQHVLAGEAHQHRRVADPRHRRVGRRSPSARAGRSSPRAGSSRPAAASGTPSRRRSHCHAQKPRARRIPDRESLRAHGDEGRARQPALADGPAQDRGHVVRVAQGGAGARRRERGACRDRARSGRGLRGARAQRARRAERGGHRTQAPRGERRHLRLGDAHPRQHQSHPRAIARGAARDGEGGPRGGAQDHR